MGTAEWNVAERARPLEHENRQVGFVIQCPHCESDMIVPVADFLDGAENWQQPPQNAAFAANGWHFGWGTELSPNRLHLRQTMAVPHGDHQPGADDMITCSRREWGPLDAQGHADIVNSGCGRAYKVVQGKLLEVE